MTDLINFPTFDQIMDLTVGSVVRVTLRARSGERATLEGRLHAPGSGARAVGPYRIAFRGEGRYGTPAVPVEVVTIQELRP